MSVLESMTSKPFDKQVQIQKHIQYILGHKAVLS